MAADWIENLGALWYLNDGPRVSQWVLSFAARVKWWGVAVAVLLLAVFALFHPINANGDVWLSQLPQRLRGISAERTAVFVVALIAALFLVPMAAEQIHDVVRRFKWSDVLITSTLVLMLAAFVGLSARRVWLRVETRTRRWEPTPDASTRIEEPSLVNVLSSRQEWTRRAWDRRFLVGSTLVALGVMGAVVAYFAGGFLKGLAVPALGVLVLTVAGFFMSEAPTSEPPAPTGSESPTPRRRFRVSRFTPSVLAASVPVLVGFGIVSAAVPEFALNRSHGPEFPLLLIVLLVPIAWSLYLSVERLVSRMDARQEPLSELRARWSRAMVWVGIIGLLALTIAVATKPSFLGGLTGAWLIFAGSALFALGHAIFYFFDGDLLEEDPLDDMRQRRLVAEGPASLLPSPGPGLGKRNRIVLVLWAAAAATGIVLIWLAPVGMPRAIGGLEVALFWILLLGLLAEWLSRGVESTASPRLFVHLGIKRIPVLVLGFVWIALMASSITHLSFLRTPEFHDVELIEATGDSAAARRATAETIFNNWLERNGLEADQHPAGATPMVFVAAWGGGIRAGVWTAYVLDCALEVHDDPTPWNDADSASTGPCRVAAADGDTGRALGSLVALKGISGGSMGIAEYLALVDQAGEDQTPSAHDWVEERMGDDYLSPPLARLLFTDIPLGVAGGSEWWDDRGDVIQRAWEQSWPDKGLSVGFVDLMGRHPEFPVSMFSAASLNDACAVNLSHMDASPRTMGDGAAAALANECGSLVPFLSQEGSVIDPKDIVGTLAATHDLVRILCADEDIRLSAAALASARFPVITPSGRFVTCTDSDREARGLPSHVYATDGGVLDASSMLGVVQLWESLEQLVTEWNQQHDGACIAPVLIHTQNGFKELATGPASASPPNEWIDPVTFTFTSAAGGLEQNFIQRAGVEFNEPIMTAAGPAELIMIDDEGGRRAVPRLAFIRTKARPGAEVPLGWTLSQHTIEALASQLGQNTEEFEIVQTWLDADLECTPLENGSD